MTKELMKGNEALAEAAIRAGCRFFAGYPITPQSEILEYLSWRMPEAGGTFIQSESEIAGISMVYGAAATGFRTLTSSSGPGFSLKQEGISYIAAAELPCVVVDVMRYGSGIGDIYQAQGDYWQATKGGGHGDYKVLVYAPASVQENADLTYLAYDKADEYLNPVLILSDGAIGQMMEPVELPEMKTHDPDKFEWSMKGNKDGRYKQITSRFYYQTNGDIKAYEKYLKAKYDKIEELEQKWESVETSDAEIILVSYGISSRICKEAIKIARGQNIKLGLIRPITLWPFPKLAFNNLPKSLKGFLSVEMSCLGQMVDDVALASRMKAPVYSFLSGGFVPEANKIVEMVKGILSDSIQEVY